MATLTVNCNGTPTTYSWTGTGASTCTTQTCGPFAVAATTTFTATATNASGGNTSPPVTITIGGGGGGPIACSNVPGATHVIDFGSLAAGAGSSKTTQSVGGFGPNDALVIRFTASPALTTQTNLGNLSAAEFGDQPAPRYGALSASSCDFTGGIVYSCVTRRGTVNLNTLFTPGTQTPSQSYGVVATSCSPLLVPGQVYYWNLTNINPATGATGCFTATCNMIVNMQAPNGQ
jgi:hypothetical protein